MHTSRGPWRNTLPLIAGASLLFLTAATTQATIDATLQMQLGNPTGATADTNNLNHYLIQRPVEAIDYNDLLGQPNWASWDLTSSDIGSSGRSNDWQSDTNLPSNFYPVPADPFSGSDYDRGHMCPSADRTDTLPDNEMLFLMSNIIPQASAQNEGIWANLENYCRQTLLTGGNELLITCGPSLFTTSTLNNGHVTIPSYTWKIIVVCPPGSGAATNRITPTTQVVAVRIPNTDAVGSDPWQNYRTNVVAIEADTGFNFFTALPHNLSMTLHYKIDGQTPGATVVSGFSPGSGAPNSSVTITGSNLAFITNVAFHGINASFIINSASNISATVPANATTGTIALAGIGGNVTTSSNFNVITTSGPDLAIVATHTGNFSQSDIGDTYTILVTNVSTTTFTGSLTVTDALPAGLTATAISGAGWATNLSSLTATRSDTLPAGSAYPPITITVNVAANAPASVTNIANLSSASDTNLLNNTASDITVINGESAPLATTGVATAINTNRATLNGTVNPDGVSTVAQFEYGLTTNYGTTVAISGAFSGMSAQAVSTNITGLVASTTYHFRLDATNNLGSSTGADQTFNTAALPSADLTVLLSHSGNFTQGDTNDHYTIIVTNIGAAASLGSVTITDAVPAGLTLTAFSGSGWTLNPGARTCSRSDTLTAGASYPAITVTVSAANNAPSLVTNIVSVSGGGDSNLANNSASDTTIINSSQASIVTLAGWDTSTLVGGTGIYGPSPFAPTTNASHLSIVGLTRGSGVQTTGSGANRAWGGDGFTSTSSASAITAGQYGYFSIAASNGYTVSYSAISEFDYRHSGQGPTNGLLQYQIGSGPFVDVTNIAYPSSSSSGDSVGAIDLSGVSALQSVPAGTNVTFRIVNWGAQSASGTWYIFDTDSSSASDFAVQGTVSPAIVPAADLAISISHTGNFTQADIGDTYTITVTNVGTGPTTGAVNISETLPGSLTVTAITGSGWTVDLNGPSCTRSDPLSAGAGYPPITVTVNVKTNAAASVTNVVTVFNSGDSNSANNTASDATTVIALPPVQAWRYAWFGTTANIGNAADGAILTSDGIPNLLKYALGLNPLVATNNPVIYDTTSGHLRLTAPKNPDATDVIFYVKITDDPTANTWTTNGTTVDINSSTVLEVHDNAPIATSPSGYIRLSVSRP